MEIRDTRNGEWHWVNNAVTACVHIKPHDKVVYSALCTFAGCKEIRPDFELIAKRSAVSIRKAKEAILKLIEVGYVSKVSGGGRGRANVYKLLKVPKGCKFCTVSKPCKIGKKTVQVTTINGASFAPQIDKEVDKEIDNSKATALRGNNTLLIGVIDLFKEVNPAYRKWFANTTQRGAVERLLECHGFEKLQKVIAILPRTNKLAYIPTITTPLQLEDKWASLEAGLIKYKSKQFTIV